MPPGVLFDFHELLKTHNIKTKQSLLDSPNRVNFHLINLETKNNATLNKYSFIKEEAIPTTSIIYQNEQNTAMPLCDSSIKTILVREALPKSISIDFEVENCQDERETLAYLVSTTKILMDPGEIWFIDLHVDGKNGRETSLQKVWTSMIYQVPGIGFDKAEVIRSAYPNFSSLILGLRECELQHLPVKRKEKTTKLGQVLAERIERVFTSRNTKELL